MKEKKTKRIFLLIFISLNVILMNACNFLNKKWDIVVLDENNKTIEGVKIQISSDNMSMIYVTDSNGTIDFALKGESYKLDILSCPIEYDYNKASITIKKNEENKIILQERTKISFSSLNLNGEILDDSILKENKVTMINLWEPWCTYCKYEMPNLEKLYQEYKDQGFLIIGAHGDDYGLESVLENYQVSYPIIKTTSEFSSIIDITLGYPTSFFLDSEGYIILPSYQLINDLSEKINIDENCLDSGYYLGAYDYDIWNEIIKANFAKVL